MEKIIALLIALLLLPLFYGLLISLMWGWYISPVFGLPNITILQGFGLMLTVRIISGKSGYSGKEQTKEEQINTLLNGLVLPVLTVLFGFVLSLFI